MKAFVVAFNRLTMLQNLCAELTKRGCEVFILDNNSSYPPLKEWLNKLEYPVIEIGENLGSRALWTAGIAPTTGRYIVSDHDLDISHVPMDMLRTMNEALDHNKTVIKAGLSLFIDDLPKNAYTAEILKHERQFYRSRSACGKHFSAAVDTTIAMYDADRMKGMVPAGFFNAVRLAPPYYARHLPWYNTPANLTDEEKYYSKHIGNDGFWTRKFLETFKIEP